MGARPRRGLSIAISVKQHGHEDEAEEKLDEILVDARRGQLRQKRTGYTFADIAEDWYERGRFERDWSASTHVDYRSVLDAHLLPEFGHRRIETISAAFHSKKPEHAAGCRSRVEARPGPGVRPDIAVLHAP